MFALRELRDCQIKLFVRRGDFELVIELFIFRIGSDEDFHHVAIPKADPFGIEPCRLELSEFAIRSIVAEIKRITGIESADERAAGEDRGAVARAVFESEVRSLFLAYRGLGSEPPPTGHTPLGGGRAWR